MRALRDAENAKLAVAATVQSFYSLGDLKLQIPLKTGKQRAREHTCPCAGPALSSDGRVPTRQPQGKGFSGAKGNDPNSLVSAHRLRFRENSDLKKFEMERASGRFRLGRNRALPLAPSFGEGSRS